MVTHLIGECAKGTKASRERRFRSGVGFCFDRHALLLQLIVSKLQSRHVPFETFHFSALDSQRMVEKSELSTQQNASLDTTTFTAPNQATSPALAHRLTLLFPKVSCVASSPGGQLAGSPLRLAALVSGRADWIVRGLSSQPHLPAHSTSTKISNETMYRE